MKHLEASNLLTEFVSRSLSPERRLEVEAHVEECAECHAWVTTHLLLSGALAAETGESTASHPSAFELSSLALAAHTLSDDVREGCARHVANCAGCRQEMELVQAAATAAREVDERPAARRRFASSELLAWAAGLLLVVGAVAYFGIAAPPPPESHAENRQLQGETIDDSRLIEATESIFVGATEMRKGAVVSLQAGRAVTFGNGFSVGSGASLDVRIAAKDDSRVKL